MSTNEIVVQEDASSVTLFHTDDPLEVLHRAAPLAKELAKLVRSQKLIVRIGQSEHVRVEGWTLLGSMLGVFPIVEWTRPVLQDEKPVGWEARVVARTRAGETVGAGEAECLRSERTWSGRDDYALRSMAQTRAVSKALRLPLGFVMQLAGFNPTPAEEMPTVEHPPVVDSQRTRTASEGVPPTTAQKKKLDVLVAKLREAERIDAYHLWEFMGKTKEMEDAPGAIDDDLVIHWAPLRELLSKDEASFLIDTLERFSADPEAVWAAGSSSTNEEPQAEVTSGAGTPSNEVPVSQDATVEHQASSGLTMTEFAHLVKEAGVKDEYGAAAIARLYPGRKSSELTDGERAKLWAELESSIAEGVA